ncbi:hypothetical protein P7C71_g3842, partial [Lecanoromycetidae sp. Uapishka_2]
MAMGILNHNTRSAKSHANKGHLETMVLDWEESLPEAFSRSPKDVILVSDCTYNSDSTPALVKVLAALIRFAPTALIVVSMKVRHDSEAIFFDLMSDAGLTAIEHTAISLPDRLKLDTGEELEVVHIYVYRKK